MVNLSLKVCITCDACETLAKTTKFVSVLHTNHSASPVRLAAESQHFAFTFDVCGALTTRSSSRFSQKYTWQLVTSEAKHSDHRGITIRRMCQSAR